MTNRHSIIGCLVGTAVGDCLGLPSEGLSRRRIAKRFPGAWRHRLIGRWGMCSDDTEHAFLVAQSLLAAGGDPDRFRRGLAWRLRWWFLALPAGVGMATARACIKLWLGWPSTRSGVWSAGNGPAMRAPLIGAVFANDDIARHTHVDASTRLTHRDPLAVASARCIADLAAALADDAFDPARWLAKQIDHVDQARLPQWHAALADLRQGLREDSDLHAIAKRFGIETGISGYCLHTAVMVLAAVHLHLDEPAAGLEALYRCGGDTDTTGAIAGALLGVRHGPDPWPPEWVSGIHNGPLSIGVLRKAGEGLAERRMKPVAWWWPLVPLRNLWFLIVVLAHGCRRLVP